MLRSPCISILNCLFTCYFSGAGVENGRAYDWGEDGDRGVWDSGTNATMMKITPGAGGEGNISENSWQSSSKVKFHQLIKFHSPVLDPR